MRWIWLSVLAIVGCRTGGDKFSPDTEVELYSGDGTGPDLGGAGGTSDGTAGGGSTGSGGEVGAPVEGEMYIDAPSLGFVFSWLIYGTVVECPGCAFAFDGEFQSTDGSGGDFYGTVTWEGPYVYADLGGAPLYFGAGYLGDGRAGWYGYGTYGYYYYGVVVY